LVYNGGFIISTYRADPLKITVNSISLAERERKTKWWQRRHFRKKEWESAHCAISSGMYLVHGFYAQEQSHVK